MAKHAVTGSSYIEVDDSGGIARDLSPYVEEIEPLGQEMAYLDVTGLNDHAQQIIAGVELSQEFALRGVFDDTATIGPDAVLAGIVGEMVTVSYGPAGKGSGQRKIAGQFLCLSYQVISRMTDQGIEQVRFTARFKQSGAVTLTTW